MRTIFIGLLFVTAGIMVGCDKEIKEAARPASLQSTPLHASPQPPANS